MKRLLLLNVFILIQLGLLSSQRRIDLKFKFDGFDRECIIVIPGTPPPVNGYPVVFMLHGTSGDGEKFYNISGWKELGEQENFITVFPSSLEWCWVEDGVEKRNTRWVNGNVTENPCAIPQDYVDDVKFLKKIANLLIDSLPVNKKKIFASGFSNGSSMIHKLAIEAGDVFSAVAGTGAPISLSDSAAPIKRIPAWFMVGTLDDRFIKPPLTELPYGRDSIITYLERFLNAMLGCQGLTNNFNFQETALTHTYIYNESQSGENSAPYHFTLIKDLEHMYPMGTNFPLNAPRIFWMFFNNSTTTNVNIYKSNSNWMEAYPNPSHENIFLKINEILKDKIERIHIFNALGHNILSITNTKNGEFLINKADIGHGVFLIQADFTNQVYSKKIVILK